MADASTSIGTGHVVRSLVLASELSQLDIQTVMAGIGVTKTARSVPSLQETDRIELQEAFDARERLNLVRQIEPDLVVVDGYQYPVDLFKGLDDNGTKYGIIDDYGETSALNPIFIVNQNPSATLDLYSSRFPNSRLFLGLDYCLIRQEIREARGLSVEDEHVMVSLGGSDPLNLSLVVARVLSKLNIKTHVAVGPLVSEREILLQAIKGLRGVRLVNQDEFVTSLSTARIAVLGAGSALWEAAYLAKPTIGIIVAQNQASTRVTSRFSSPRLWYLEGDASSAFDSRLEALVKKLLLLHSKARFDLEEKLRPEKIASRLNECTRFILTESAS